MKVQRLGHVLFLAVTFIVFMAGTVFTFLHRYNADAKFFSKDNILALAGGAFLTVGELALIYAHALIGAKEFWRRITALAISVVLAISIAFATYTEAQAYMEEGNIKTKAGVIQDFSEGQQAAARSGRERRLAITTGQKTLKDALSGMSKPEFAPFAINFLIGLLAILVCSFITPGKPWKRRTGNQMTPEIAEKARVKFGLAGGVSEEVKAYHDGRGDSYIIKRGREYLGTVSKKDLQ